MIGNDSPPNANLDDVTCIGKVPGIVGKIKLLPECDWKLILILKWKSMGTIHSDIEVFRIEKVHLLSLGEEPPGDFEREV